MSIPISYGAGTASVASEKVGNNDYQQIKVIDGTAASTNTWTVNSDGSAMVSVFGTPTVHATGSVFATFSGSGSIVAVLQSSSILAVPVGSVITVAQGSIAAVIVGGSIATAAAANQSVSGTVVAEQGTTPWIITGSVQGTFTSAANQSVSGTVDAAQIGTWRVSVIGSVPSSLLAGVSIMGQLPAGTAPLGSVAVLQGTNPWAVTNTGSIITTQIGSVITVWKDSSVLAVPVGSVITVWGKSPSVVGTYAEDAAHTSGDKGLFTFGVRNDTLASVTSADGDYSQFSTGPSGEVVAANAPLTAWIRGTADLRVVQGASVTAIAAQGASIFTYITGIQLANMGSASVLVTFAGGLGSILGYSIAPAGGGSNILYPNALKTGENSAFTASISGTASVLVSAQGFTSKS